MTLLAKLNDNGTWGLNFKKSLFHKLILAFLCLNFFVACGYKGDPVYELKDSNGTVIKSRKYQDINRW